MSKSTKPAVIALTLCGVLDLLAAPVLLASNDPGAARTAAAMGAAVFGIVTILAAAGLARGARWARPTALVSRIVDVVAALPGLGAGSGAGGGGVGGGLVAAIATVVVVSIVAVVLVVRLGRVEEAKPVRPIGSSVSPLARTAK